MAKRRMLSLEIINSDSFLDMPLSSQALYMHLVINADDDGFINNYKMIMRMIRASEDDIKVLTIKNFIIPFESGIIVIKHWQMQNSIRKDRYKKTNYLKEKAQLFINSHDAYALLSEKNNFGNQMATNGMHRLGEVSIGKGSLEEKIYKKEIVKYFDNSEVNESFIEYLQIRKKSKWSNSDSVIKRLIKTLVPHDDDIKIKILDMSIVRNYRDLFEPKNNISSNSNGSETIAEKTKRIQKDIDGGKYDIK